MQEFLQPTETTDFIREVVMILIGLASRYLTLKRMKKESEQK